MEIVDITNVKHELNIEKAGETIYNYTCKNKANKATMQADKTCKVLGMEKTFPGMTDEEYDEEYLKALKVFEQIKDIEGEIVKDDFVNNRRIIKTVAIEDVNCYGSDIYQIMSTLNISEYGECNLTILWIVIREFKISQIYGEFSEEEQEFLKTAVANQLSQDK